MTMQTNSVLRLMLRRMTAIIMRDQIISQKTAEVSQKILITLRLMQLRQKRQSLVDCALATKIRLKIIKKSSIIKKD